MFKLAISQVSFLLFACCFWNVVSGSYLPVSVPLHLEYAPTVVGHRHYSVPTAVSHQSQTIVHDSRPYLHPVVSHAPIVKSHVLPISTLSYSPYAYSRFGYSGHNDWAPSYGGLWSPWQK